jgi:hypothetical protein
MLSFLHLEIIDFISLNYPFLKIEKEYRIKKSKLRLDIYLPDISLGIEIQGIQHYEQNQFFHKTSNSFLESNLRDREKYLLSINNGIFVLYVKYNEEDPLKKIKATINRRISLMEYDNDIMYIANRFHNEDEIDRLVCPVCRNRFDFKNEFSKEYGETFSDVCCGRKFILVNSGDKYMTITEKIR